MTSLGPQPGWHLDPDGSAKERYWSGSSWTGIYRSARVDKALVFEQEVAAASDPRAAVLRVGRHAKVIASDYAHHDQTGTIDGISSSDGTVYVDLLFADDPVAYTFRVDEVAAVARPKSTASAPTGTVVGPASVAQPHPSGLNVGDLAKIVVADPHYEGRIGQVVALKGTAITLKVKGAIGTFDFRRDHLVAVEDATGPRPDSAPSEAGLVATTSPPPVRRTVAEASAVDSAEECHGPAAGSRPPQSSHFWARMSTGGRITVVATALLTLVLIIWAATPGHSESWEWGYDRAGAALELLDAGASVRQACSMSMTHAALLEQHEPLEQAEVIAGCIQGVKDATK